MRRSLLRPGGLPVPVITSFSCPGGSVPQGLIMVDFFSDPPRPDSEWPPSRNIRPTGARKGEVRRGFFYEKIVRKSLDREEKSDRQIRVHVFTFWNQLGLGFVWLQTFTPFPPTAPAQTHRDTPPRTPGTRPSLEARSRQAGETSGGPPRAGRGSRLGASPSPPNSLGRAVARPPRPRCPRHGAPPPESRPARRAAGPHLPP